MSYVYLRAPGDIYKTGFFQPNGIWVNELDCKTAEEAASRVSWLNGGESPHKPRYNDAPATYSGAAKEKFPICEVDGCRNKAKSVEGRCRKHTNWDASDIAKELAQQWLDHPHVMAGDDCTLQWQKLFDDLHRLDKLSYEDIRSISDHALQEWVPQNFMLTPMKLRQPSKTYPDLKTWNLILQQSKNGSIHRNSAKQTRAAEAFKNIDFS